MDDMPRDYWTASREQEDNVARLDNFQARLSCREKAAWPDKCGDVAKIDEVRRRRASWAVDIGERYSARVVEWCDTGEALEKQAVIVLLRPPGEAPVVLVAWRGSKKLTDYLLTDLSLSFIPIPSNIEDSEAQNAGHGMRLWNIISRGMPMLFPRSSDVPCVTRGLWEAYAGSATRERTGLGPRLVVQAALARLLAEEPQCRICITGHSLGGALATLCAYDLLLTSPAVRARGVTMVSFGSPRLFNAAFQQATAALRKEDKLRPMRVLIAGDIVTRLPPRQIGGMHGVQPRMALNPLSPRGVVERPTLSFRDGEGEDVDWSGVALDLHAHTSYALFLGGECTPTRPQTIPLHEHWPLVNPLPSIYR